MGVSEKKLIISHFALYFQTPMKAASSFSTKFLDSLDLFSSVKVVLQAELLPKKAPSCTFSAYEHCS